MANLDEATDFDRLLDHVKSRLTNLHELPTIAAQDALDGALKELIGNLPASGRSMDEVTQYVENVILPALAPGHAGPRYFGFVIGGAVPAALYGDILASSFDQNAHLNLPGETITALVENRALGMVLELLNLPPADFPVRTITTGATASNVVGLAVGREFAIREALGDPSYSVAEDGFGGVVVRVLSDRPHASLIKAASLVGIGRSNVIDLYDPSQGQMDLDKIEGILSSRTSGEKIGYIVSPSLGEVNTGEFTNNIAKIRELCDKYHAWMHIDAAFGAFARVLPELRHVTNGLELADSIASDGHKWLNVPYDAGLFFSRSLEVQTSVFGPSKRSAPPPYLNVSAGTSTSLEMTAALAIPSPLNIGIENSRRFRALPMFCALLSLGRSGYEEIIRRNIQFARDIANWMIEGEGKEWYEVLNATYDVEFKSFLKTVSASSSANTRPLAVPLNVVLFRARGSVKNAQFDHSAGDGFGNARLVQAINSTRRMYVSPGKGGIRLAVSNWMTGLRKDKEGRGDFEIVIETLKEVMLDTLKPAEAH